jgi:hypothetical protein
MLFSHENLTLTEWVFSAFSHKQIDSLTEQGLYGSLGQGVAVMSAYRPLYRVFSGLHRVRLSGIY